MAVVRFYRNKDRIRSALESFSTAKMESAKDGVEEELGQSLAWEDYLSWFGETLGTNLGLIHRAGYWHGWVSVHNVTLASEIVDFGFGKGSKRLKDLTRTEKKQHRQRDFRDGLDTLNNLVRYSVKQNLIIPDKNLFQVFDLYEEAYESAGKEDRL